MSAPLKRLAEELVVTATRLQESVAQKQWGVAHPDARSCSRLAGQLLQRLTVMKEIFDQDD